MEAFDLLVGADGTHSSVRQQIFGADEQFSYYLTPQVVGRVRYPDVQLLAAAA